MSNRAIEAEKSFKTSIEEASEYIENFDILETINNVGNDEVFTPVVLCGKILDILPSDVWSNPNYKWLNPCDKNGVFLREIALRLDHGLKDVMRDQETRRKHILQNMLYSIGLTRFTSLVSRRTNYYCSVANKVYSNDTEGFSIGNGTWFDDANGNIKTPIKEHQFGKDGKCIYCRTSSKNSKYNDSKQIEHYAYDFIHTDGIEEYLTQVFFKGDKSMKFDIIIGNPPYQLSDGGAQASAMPIYQLFIEQAQKLNPKYLSMIVPSRWMSGGKGLDSFRKEMISDKRIKILHDFIDSKECFPNNDVKGGICYFLWDSDYNDKCTITTYYKDGTKETSKRFLKESEADIYIRDTMLVSIFEKTRDGSDFSNIVSPRKPYGLSGEVFTKPKKYGLPPFQDEKFANSITVQGLIDNKRVVKYMDKNRELKDVLGNFEFYKVFLPEANGSGTIGEVLSTPIIGTPMEICTETFLSIGKFKTLNEAENCITYIKSKFFRTLLGIKKITQHNSKEVFSFIPMQDFSKSWTDSELYRKYKLNEKEIEYIEKYIKEMI